MKKIHILITIVVFFLVGEFLIRINKKYDLLSNAPEIIVVKIEDSELKTAIDTDNFKVDSDQFRVLVIGDSYIYGGGIKPEDKFSKKLDELLEDSSISEKKVHILDISRASNNTLDNYKSFIHYQERFKPHYVFWAYNFNDIIGDFSVMAIKNKKSDSRDLTVTPPKRSLKKRTGFKGFVKKMYTASELLRYVSTNIQKELKLNGIVIPMGDFHYLTQSAYLDTNVNWVLTKKIWNDVSDICELNDAKFVLYKMPEFNLLDNLDLFTEMNSSINNFCNQNKGIHYINGETDFMGVHSKNYMLSKYDGHPNALAHKKIAERIVSEMRLDKTE